MNTEAAMRETDYIIVIKESAYEYLLTEFRDVILEHGLNVQIKDEKEFKEIVKML